MRNSKKGSSTQKLLDLIRSGGQDKFIPVDMDESSPCLPAAIKSRHLNLGVWMTQRDLTLALTTDKGVAKKKGLIKWETVLLPENLSPSSDEFPVFLGDCLDHFLENRKNISIWCALETADLKIRNITIPDLPKAKIANAAFWGFKKETDVTENQEIFNFEILRDVSIDGNKKKNILVFSADRAKIAVLKETFKKAGYPLKGITAIPFAMQNYIRSGQIRVDDPYFVMVNIARDNTDICCFSQFGILLVRNLRMGTQNLIEDLNRPGELDPIGYLSAMTDPGAEDFSRIKDTCDRLISKILRTGDYCAQHYAGNTPIKRYVFYGETDACKLFMNQAAATVPAEIEILDPSGDPLSVSTEAALPQTAIQRNAVLTALGVALSCNDITPNFLFTADDRHWEKKQKQITLATVLTGIILLFMCFSAQFLLNVNHQKHLSTLAQLSQEQKTFTLNPQKEAFAGKMIASEKKYEAGKQYIARYLPLAFIYDLCHVTPPHIHLSGMTYVREKDKTNPGKTLQKLFVQGQVSGNAYMLDSELGAYILKLSESPVFGYIEITDKRTNKDDLNTNLFFKATLEVR